MVVAFLVRPFTRVVGSVVRQPTGAAYFHAAAQTYTYRTQACGQGRVREPQSFTGGTQSSQPSGRGLIRSFAAGQAISGSADRSPQEVKPMEVEIKIRLPDRAAYDKVATALATQSGNSEEGARPAAAQANYFFDGPNRELNSRRVVLRLRTYNGDEKATITLKGKQVLENGIGRASEVEEDVCPRAATGYLTAPEAMLHEVPLIRTTAEKFGLSSLVSLGGFRNRREYHVWEGHTLELDETDFEHGTLYEIECETDQPEALRDKLEAFLTSLGVTYSYSQTSKFANFINKTLL